MTEEILAITEEQLKSVVECMLFVSPQPLSVKSVSQALNLEEPVVDTALRALQEDFADRGLQVARIAGGYQMCTRPEFSHYVSLLLKPERTRLSHAGLETVAIVAYRQPITQPEVEAIRGVNSDGVLKTLMERNLIRQAGRKDSPGRPMLYTTSEEFLNYFGLNDLSELPELEDIILPKSAEETPADASVVEASIEETD